MKHRVIAAAIIGLAAFSFGGCANNAPTTPAERSYSQKDLTNTGRHDSADAIQAVDPSVNISSGRR